MDSLDGYENVNVKMEIFIKFTNVLVKDQPKNCCINVKVIFSNPSVAVFNQTA